MGNSGSTNEYKYTLLFTNKAGQEGQEAHLGWPGHGSEGAYWSNRTDITHIAYVRSTPDNCWDYFKMDKTKSPWTIFPTIFPKRGGYSSEDTVGV